MNGSVADEGSWYEHDEQWPEDNRAGCLQRMKTIPTWQPKDDDAVFFLSGNGVQVGRYMIATDVYHAGERFITAIDGMTFSAKGIPIKQFRPWMIGKPWGEL